MKHFLLVVIASLISVCQGFAQFNFVDDTVEIWLPNNELSHVNIVIDNSQSSSDLEYLWYETYRYFNPSWEIQVCDCRYCYAEFQSIPEDTTFYCDGFYSLPSGQSFSGFIFYANPFDVADSGVLTLNFEAIGSPVQPGQVTFKAYSSPTSVGDELEESKLIDVYPNPVSDMLYINLNAFDEKEVSLRIIDIQGKVVKNNNLPGGQTVFQVNCNNFPSGIYFVELLDESGDLMTTEKIVVE